MGPLFPFPGSSTLEVLATRAKLPQPCNFYLCLWEGQRKEKRKKKWDFVMFSSHRLPFPGSVATAKMGPFGVSVA